MTADTHARQSSSRAEREAYARKCRGEGLLLREIAAKMGVAISTVDAYLNDPGGHRMRARKNTYRGECEICGGPTDGSNGPMKSPDRCQQCLTWTPEAVLDALRDWGEDHGGIPPREKDARIGGEGHRRLPYEATVRKHFGSWNKGLFAAGYVAVHHDRRPETTAAMIEAVRAGEPVQAIADRFGVSPHAVYVRLRYHGQPVSELRRAA